jgi:hypothetical protein
MTTRLLAELEDFFTTTAEETSAWTDPTDSKLTPATRQRLETIRDRHPNLLNR